MGSERASQSSWPGFREIPEEDKKYLERQFPLRGKTVTIERGFFAHQKRTEVWRIELLNVWNVTQGKSKTAPLEPGVVAYEVKLTTEDLPPLTIYLKAWKLFAHRKK